MGKLRTFAERIERLHEEKRSIEEDIREVYAELAAEGYDKKAMREVIKRRSKDPQEACEFEAIVELYLQEISGPSRARTRDARDTREATKTPPSGYLTAAQSEGAAGSTPEKAEPDSAAGGAGLHVPAQGSEFVTHSGAGEGVAALVDPAPAADIHPIAKPYDPGPIPAFLDRRINKPEAAA